MFHHNNPTAIPIQEMFNQLFAPQNEPSTSRINPTHAPVNGAHVMPQGPLEVKQQLPISSIRSVDQLEEMYPTDCSLYKQLIEEGYFNHRSVCVKCGKDMTLRRRGDSHEWRCRKERKRDCSSKSIKKTSWFDRTAVKTREILKLTIMWINKCPSYQISQTLGLSSTTTVDYKNFLREICVKTAETFDPIGGPGREIHIGITQFIARRCNKQDSPKEVNKVLGGFQRDANGCNKCFAFEIENLGPREIFAMLNQKLHPASIIYSELYKIYPELVVMFPNNGLRMDYYGNQNPANAGINAEALEKQSALYLEAFWDRLKQPLKDAHGASEGLVGSYLAEFVVREREGERFPYVIFEYIRKFRKQ